MYNPTGGIWRGHTHPHTHDSNNFPPPAACCGSWSAASVNWSSAEKEEEKEEGAAGHEQQRRWRPIGNQCTMSISAPYGQNTRSDSCHSAVQPAPPHTERENVNHAASTLSGVHFCSLLIDFINQTRWDRAPFFEGIRGNLGNSVFVCYNKLNVLYVTADQPADIWNLTES